MNVKYSEEEKDAWEHLYLLGFSSIKISKIRGAKLPSVKGHIKKLGIQRSYSEAHKGREPWNKGKTGVQEPWNKGKTGVQSSTRKGTKQPKRGPRKPEDIQKIKDGWKRKLESGWNNFGGFGQKPTPEQRLLPGILYFVKYEDEGEHYKIGITRRTIQERLKTRLIEVVATYESTLGECFDLEQRILKDLDEFRYSSATTTELFTPESLPLVLNLLDQFSN